MSIFILFQFAQFIVPYLITIQLSPTQHAMAKQCAPKSYQDKRCAARPRRGNKNRRRQFVCGVLAGEEGFEPSAYGFGDRRSTN